MNIIHGKLLQQELRLGPVRGFVCWVTAALEPAGKGLGGMFWLPASLPRLAGCSYGFPVASQDVPALVPVKWSGAVRVPCSCHSSHVVLSVKLEI